MRNTVTRLKFQDQARTPTIKYRYLGGGEREGVEDIGTHDNANLSCAQNHTIIISSTEHVKVLIHSIVIVVPFQEGFVGKTSIKTFREKSNPVGPFNIL